MRARKLGGRKSLRIPKIPVGDRSRGESGVFRHRALTLLSLIAFAGAFLAAPGLTADGEAAPWWDKNWKCRKLVRVTIPSFLRVEAPVSDEERDEEDGDVGELSNEEAALPISTQLQDDADSDRFTQLDTAQALIYGEGKIRPDASDIRVIDANGRRVPFRARIRDDYGFIKIEFQFRRNVRDYYVYFGNPRAAREPVDRDWVPRSAVIERVTAQTSHWRLSSEEKALEAFKSARAFFKPEPLEQINQLRWRSRNVLRGKSYFVSVYHSFLNIESPGDYTFAIGASDVSFLSIDGRLVAGTPRRSRRGVRNWGTKAKVRLQSGVHYLRLIHGHTAGNAGLRLGWRRPGERDLSPVPPAAFIRHLPADEVRYETQDGPARVFFTIREPASAIDLDNYQSLATVRFKERALVDATEGVRYEWVFGKGETSRNRNPSRCLSVGRLYSVALRVHQGTQLVGEYSRPVILNRLSHHEPLNFSVDLVSCPDIVFSDEETNLSFRVQNKMDSPVITFYQAETVSGGQTVHAAESELVVPGKSYTSLLYPLDVGRLTEGKGKVTLKMLIADQTIYTEQVRLKSWSDGLGDLRNLMGQIRDEEGRKLILVTHLEDQNKYRKWAPVKWALRLADRTAKRVLLVGDAMNPFPEGRDAAAFQNYVSVLRASTGKREESFTFHESAGELMAVLEDLLALPKLLETHHPEIVILSPGLRDLMRSTPSRSLARAMDIMIDLVRTREENASIVLVSPPPLLSKPALSAEYARALRKLAADHHCPFVDIHTALQDTSGWQQLYFASPGDPEVLFLYPNREGQRKIAELISKRIF